MAIWMKDNTSPDTVIASANGGVLSWFSEREVVDTAGIEDLDAYKALKESRLYDYMKERNVQYLVDIPEWIFIYYKDRWGVDIKTKLKFYYTRFFDETREPIANLVIYKVL